MKTTPSNLRGALAGFTLVEVMISMAVFTIVMGMCLSTFLFCMKAMYKDMERLKTNASLRSFTSQIAKETVDASEYYLFPLYTKLDGSVNMTVVPVDMSTSNWITDAYGSTICYGDCLVLVTRADETSTNSAVRQFRIYYRLVTDSNTDGPVYFWESPDYGIASTQTDLVALLNSVNLNSTPVYPGARMLAPIARGRKKPGWTNTNQIYYPIFSTESATTTATNQNVSINVEFINGSSAANLLSSSSFNYTISPRK